MKNLKFSNFNLLKNLKNPPGRLDKIGEDWNVFIDYAHTPDALKNVLSNLKKIVKVTFLQSLDVVVIETKRKDL